jgi:hypothetical protein
MQAVVSRFDGRRLLSPPAPGRPGTGYDRSGIAAGADVMKVILKVAP